jgi:glycosyltransferase involved in cell wall biosynthesis
MKKIAIIGTAGVPARYGGFETLAHHLVIQWVDKFDVTVYCSKEVYPEKNSVKEWNKAKLVYLPFSANGVQSIIYDIVSIIHALFYADVLLVLGVSGCVLVPFIKIFTKKNIVVHIDGLEWKRNKWARPIQKFLKFSERLAVKYSDADVADNEAIKQYTAQEYGSLSYQIEYGADHVMKVIPDLADLKKYPFLEKDYAFNVCRIEPENNVAIILEAFSKTTTLPLVMVGNWNKSEYGTNLKAKYAQYGHIHLLDAIYNQRELDVLRSNCMLYLHGHSAGGTNPSLVEAMYLRLPILAFNVAYNVSTTEGKALYFDNAEDIVHKLDNLKSLSLPRIAVIMEEIAVRRYRWPVIASKYAQLVNAFDYKYVKAKTSTILKTLDGSELYHNEVSHLNQSKPFYETI